MIALHLSLSRSLSTSWAHIFTHVIGSYNRYAALLEPQDDVAAAFHRL
jgi:hypothetical protein